MELYYDLHLHSCLSPCGDRDMTPANIAGMACVNGLQLVALTDHNTVRNCPAFLAAAESYGLLALPGMELTTAEEIHVVCLFPSLEPALLFDSFVYDHLMKIPNRPDIFGEQLLYDTDDQPCGQEPNLLINATDIPFQKVWDIAAEYGGVMIPAHIDKSSNSLISQLGMVPEDSRFACFELHDMKNLHRVREANPCLEHCRVICNSDAHYLPDIHEAGYSLSVPEAAPDAVIAVLRQPLG